VTSGTYDATFDMTSSTSYVAAFLNNYGGTVDAAFDGLIDGIDAGKAYFNIHTSFALSGEIRGFLAPIPEPEIYAMMGVGLGLMGWIGRRRKLQAA